VVTLEALLRATSYRGANVVGRPLRLATLASYIREWRASGHNVVLNAGSYILPDGPVRGSSGVDYSLAPRALLLGATLTF
jgi:hypothetical protein